MLASASDDKTIKVFLFCFFLLFKTSFSLIQFWDVRTTRPIRTIQETYPQTAVVMMEDGINCLHGGVDGVITV